MDVSAVERARWLVELSLALDEAQEIVNCISFAGGRYVETLDLAVRIESARAEVRSLRRSPTGEPIENIDPNWSKYLSWDRALPEQRAQGPCDDHAKTCLNTMPFGLVTSAGRCGPT
jgi:hypothetical protein